MTIGSITALAELKKRLAAANTAAPGVVRMLTRCLGSLEALLLYRWCFEKWDKIDVAIVVVLFRQAVAFPLVRLPYLRTSQTSVRGQSRALTSTITTQAWRQRME